VALWTEVATSEVSGAKNEKTNRKSFARALLARAQKAGDETRVKHDGEYSGEITPKL